MKKRRIGGYSNYGCYSKESTAATCSELIIRMAEKISNNFNVDKDKIKEILENLAIEVSYEIENIEEDPLTLDDFDDDEMEDHLRYNGYLVLKAPSLKERYKVEAFMEKLKNDPYGSMIIL